MKLADFLRALLNGDLLPMDELRSALASEVQALREQVHRLVQLNAKPDLAWCNAAIFCDLVSWTPDLPNHPAFDQDTNEPQKPEMGWESTMLAGEGAWLRPGERKAIVFQAQRALSIGTIHALGPSVVSQVLVAARFVFQGENAVVYLSARARVLVLPGASIVVDITRLPR
jgi:hypothetical protein